MGILPAMTRPRLLLHVCCAPCATAVMERLSRDYQVTAYFYGPNIHPEQEYELRLGEMQRMAIELSVPLISGPYDPDRWFQQTAGHEHDLEGGERCQLCYRLRLENAAHLARNSGFERFATTLSVSPHKQAEAINQIGQEIAERHQLKFLAADFKKQNGFKRSVELSHRMGLYRQSYCGCTYSRRQG